MSKNKANYGNRCMESHSDAAVSWNVPQHRLDDRIRQLCAKVVSGSDADSSSIAELKAALQEHNARLRKLAVSQLGRLWSSPNNGQQYDSQ